MALVRGVNHMKRTNGMDYAMLTLGLLLLPTCTLGSVSKDSGSKILFRLIPMCASIILLIVSLDNLNFI